MKTDLPKLPDDPQKLRDLTFSLLSEVKSQALLIEKLRHQLNGSNRHRFGTKAEGMDQLHLCLDDEEIGRASDAPKSEPEDTEPAPKAPPKRTPLPEHLP